MNADRRTATRTWAGVGALTAVGCGVWLYRLGANDYDWVIAEEVLFARQPFWRIVFHNRWLDQSPLPFVVMRLARGFGESPFAVSLPNVILLAASLISIFFVARAVSGKTAAGFVAAGLFAISPVALWCARFGRVMYPAQLLFGVWAAWAAWQYIETRRHRWLAILVGAAALSIYNHFYGFVVAGLAFAFVFGVVGIEAFIEWDGTSETARPLLARLVPPAIAAAALQLLVQPQIVRAAALLRHPFEANFLSIRGGAAWSLSRVSGFWLNGSEYGAWPLLPLWGQRAYVGAACLLFGLALVTAPGRLRAWMLLFVAGPFVLILSASSSVDLRERYFVFAAAPMLIALACGATATIAPTAGGRVRKAVRAATALAAVAFAMAAARVLTGKLPERNIEWTRLLTQVQARLTPTTVVYACPGYIAPAMQTAAERAGLDDRLAVPSAWTPAERGRLASQGDQTGAVVFIWPAGLRAQPISVCTAEMAALAGDLEGRGYAREAIFVLGAGAEVFIRREVSTTLPGARAPRGRD